MGLRAAGRLGRAVEATQVSREQVHGLAGYALGADANPLVMLRRVAFVDEAGALAENADVALLRWAADHNLGQDDEAVRHVADRRERVLQALSARGCTVVRMRVRPLWRLAVGLGERANPYELGLSLHGTFGWPVLPGSTLKGVTCAWAAQNDAPDDRLAAVFGWPRAGRDDPPADERGRPACHGSVRFLDGIPAGGPVNVSRDVLTPHVQPYYRGAAPPAEWHNPIPVGFLTVDAGSFAVDLAGPVAADVRDAADWFRHAADELGVGAKTAAGYGYLDVAEVGS
jgi:CRISPR/Cas system CMR subunit Cmr6 (Cas7 group RAMP superfamily)